MKQALHAVVWMTRHLRGVYLPPEWAFVARHLSRDSVAVDIGAHAGSWSVPMSRHLGKGMVFAIEALPYYAQTLRILFRLMRFQNIQLRNVAVTSGRCQVRMVWKDPSGRRLTGLTHVAAPGEQSGESVEVEGIPLDEILGKDRGRVEFLKVDVEVGEIGVFQGGTATLREGRPVLYSEVSSTNLARYGSTPDDLYAFLRQFEYDRYVLSSQQRLESFEDLKKTGRGDVFFVPRERQAQWVGAME